MKRSTILLCLTLAGPIACSDSPVEQTVTPVPTSLIMVDGDGQTGTVGSPLAETLKVRVLDENGSPLSGVAVNWTVAEGGGSLSSGSTSTASSGEAGVGWTLGTQAGPNSARASVTGIGAQVVFAATGEPDRPAKVVLSQEAVSFNAVGDTTDLDAGVEDRYGNDVEPVVLTWTSADPAVTTVDGDGRIVSRGRGSAQISARADTATGIALIEVEQLSAAVSVHPLRDTITAGDTLRFTATASDSNGYGIPEVSFAWTSTDTLVASVDAAGLVRGKVARSALITATRDGVSGSAEVWVVAGPAASLAVSAGDNQTGPAGERLPDSLFVRVSDAYANVVAGAAVSWLAAEGHGNPGAPTSLSTVEGLAGTEWTLGLSSGTDTLMAALAGVGGNPARFTATATPNATIGGTISVSAALQSVPAAAFAGQPRSLSGDEAPREGKLSGVGAPVQGPISTVPMEPRHVPGSLIITFRPEAVGAPRLGSRAFLSAGTAEPVAAEIRSRTAAWGADLGFDLAGISPAILASRITTDPRRVEAVRSALLEDPAILAVEPEQVFYRSGPDPRPIRTDLATSTFPADPLYAPQAWHYESIDLPETWSHQTGDANVVVAVVDDGIRFGHPAIAPNLTADGYDFTSQGAVTVCGQTYDRAHDGDGPDADPTIPLEINPFNCTLSRAGGHGLHVAGTIGAVGNDGIGVTGVNWNVSIRPIRVFGIEGLAYSWDVANGILYAAGLPVVVGGNTVQAPSPASIINMSLGSYGSALDIQSAVEAAAAAGSLLVAAAGNGNVSLPMYPAAYPQVVSVSAVAPSLQKASYSNYGSTIDIAAPGGETVLGFDFGIASTTWDFVDGVPTYAWYQGTSMASPHVAGVAALLLAETPGLTAAELRARLLDYAVDLGPAGRDDNYGHGLLNARNSLTRTFVPTRAVYAQLRDAGSGALLHTAAVGTGGAYTFSTLEDGEYFVYAGEDRDGDGLVGLAGRRWGTYTSTGTAAPTVVKVQGAGDYGASFPIGFASEREPNNGTASANLLPIGGHFHARLLGLEADYYAITIPAAATYTFETSGWDGACGYAYEEDTILALYAADGATLLDWNDDIDLASLNFCSRLELYLEPGTYYMQVTGYYGLYYRLEARPAT